MRRASRILRPVKTRDSSTAPAWDDGLLQNPHEVQDKRRRVQQMFAAIAPSYDLNNRLHSLWQDQRWRKKAVQLAMLKSADVVVDVACGTGDLALRFVHKLWNLPPKYECRRKAVVAVDFTFQMLPIARAKGRRSQPHLVQEFGSPGKPRSYADNICWLNGDAESLPLADEFADVVSIAFGIRNVQHPLIALREFHRVLRPGGRVIVLEFSLPTNCVLRGLYNFYFRKILPRTATLISGDKSGAYKYLPQSVNTFITRQSMMQMLKDVGFERVEQFPMTFGVCVCYRAVKPGDFQTS
jgi:demethylmenaquinone methyltransferase/2-methoxy-6-polyprenyl-1,4-benzoquinol methylase